MSETTTLRQFFAALPSSLKDAPCAGVAIIVATSGSPHVARTMTEEHFIALCQTATAGRAVPVAKVQ